MLLTAFPVQRRQRYEGVPTVHPGWTTSVLPVGGAMARVTAADVCARCVVPSASAKLAAFARMEPRMPLLDKRSTKDVLDDHLKAFAEGDLQGILSDYAPDVVFFTQRGPLVGCDAIRPLFQAMIAEFAKPGASFKLKQQVVKGDYGYILWTAETADNVYELGTDTLVVLGGKIVAQSFTAEIRPKGR
jgi:ketosteroid isomerase-like protein